MEVTANDLAFFLGQCSFVSIAHYVPLAEHAKKTGKTYEQILTSAIGLELRNTNPPEKSDRKDPPDETKSKLLLSSASRLARVAQSIFSDIQESSDKSYRMSSMTKAATNFNLGHQTFKILIDNLVHYGLLEVVNDTGTSRLKAWKIVTGPNYLGECGESLRKRIESALKQPFQHLENQRPLPHW